MKKISQKTIRQYAGIDAETRLNSRKSLLINAGIESFGTVGFAKSKIKDICRFAGLTERYFYESFRNKSDLLLAVHQYLVNIMERDIFEALKKSELEPIDATAESLKRFLKHFRSDPRRARIQLFEVLGADPKMARHFHRSMSSLTNHIESINQTIFGLDHDQLEATILSKSMAGAIIEVVRGWALDGFRIPEQEIVSQLVEMHTIIGNYYQDKKIVP